MKNVPEEGERSSLQDNESSSDEEMSPEQKGNNTKALTVVSQSVHVQVILFYNRS
jgi:hypothetical protein